MAENRSDVPTDRSKAASGRQQQEQGRQPSRGEQSSRQGQQPRGLARQQPGFPTSPFGLLERLADEMFSVFGRPTQSRSLFPRDLGLPGEWQPNVDVFQRGNELVIRADLPGLSADDANVEISDDAVTISGERREEREDDRGGVYRFERSYGSFFRVIPLPEGAITDQAKANFTNGVLEITVPAPPEQVSRGRRIEIGRGEEKGSERGGGAETS